MEIETANFIGLSQAGAPVMARGSSKSPARATAKTSGIVAPTNVNGRLELHARFKKSRGPDSLSN